MAQECLEINSKCVCVRERERERECAHAHACGVRRVFMAVNYMRACVSSKQKTHCFASATALGRHVTSSCICGSIFEPPTGII